MKLFTNGKISDISDGIVTYKNSMIVSDGKILWVGNDLDENKFEIDEVIDLMGKLVLPGFNDSHMHFVGIGMALLSLDLKSVRSFDMLKKEAIKFIENNNPKWLIGRGWNQDNFDEKFCVDLTAIDEISKDIPVFLKRVCGHVAIVNTVVIKMLEKANVDFSNGLYELDSYGRPTGIVKEKALDDVQRLIPEPSIKDYERSILLAQEKCFEKGLTSVQTDDFCVTTFDKHKNIIKAYKNLVERKELKIKVNHQSLVGNTNELYEFLSGVEEFGRIMGNFKYGPIKILADGSLGARTAYMKDFYNDDPSNKGVLSIEKEELSKMIQMANLNGFPVAVHAIGSATIDLVLNLIIEKGNTSLRNSIVHSQITDSDIFKLFVESNAMVHVQPIFLDYDLHILIDRVGAEIADTSYGFKTYLNQGTVMAFGSDAPVETFDVFKGIHCAVNRTDLKGWPNGGFCKEESVSVVESVTAYTSSGAYATYEENNKGRLLPGYDGDFILVENNIYEQDSKNLKENKVLGTYCNGELVYEHEKH